MEVHGIEVPYLGLQVAVSIVTVFTTPVTKSHELYNMGLNRAAQRALLWPRLWAARAGRSHKGEAFKARRAEAADPPPPRREGPADARDARVPLGQVFGRRGAAPANSMMLLPPAAVHDLMMRTAGARIMSISGARRAQTSPGMRAFGGAKMGGTTARCTNSRCPHLAQPLNNYRYYSGGSFIFSIGKYTPKPIRTNEAPTLFTECAS